jgi:DNA-binding CsgD family transcriptional regulator
VLDWMLHRIRMELIASTRLTEREIALLRYQLDGFTTKDIARIEAAAEHTINRQFGNILFKLGVSSRKEAASIARMNGLI